MNKLGIIALFPILVGLSACSWMMEHTEEEIKVAPQSGVSGAQVGGMPAGLLGEGNENQAKQLIATTQEEMMKIDSGAVYFTDAHNPDAYIPGLDEAFEQKKLTQRWYHSYEQALREARREGKAIMIWFHHSAGSPPSKKLGDELFYTKSFETWAKDNIIRVCYDQAETFENERNAQKRRRMRDYVQKAPAKFGVRGSPVVLIYSPDGTKVDTIRGFYSGQTQHYFDQIKNSTNLATERYEEFKEKMKSRGYRSWMGTNGKETFAKLSRYAEKDGTVWLRELDGHIFRTKFTSLSPNDQQWILDQKAVHDANKKR